MNSQRGIAAFMAIVVVLFCALIVLAVANNFLINTKHRIMTKQYDDAYFNSEATHEKSVFDLSRPDNPPSGVAWAQGDIAVLEWNYSADGYATLNINNKTVRVKVEGTYQ